MASAAADIRLPFYSSRVSLPSSNTKLYCLVTEEWVYPWPNHGPTWIWSG